MTPLIVSTVNDNMIAKLIILVLLVNHVYLNPLALFHDFLYLRFEHHRSYFLVVSKLRPYLGARRFSEGYFFTWLCFLLNRFVF